MRLLRISSICLLLLVAAGVGYHYRGSIRHLIGKVVISEKQQTQELEEARRLIDEGKAHQALLILQRYDYQFARDNPLARKSLALYLEAAAAANDSGQLIQLYNSLPQALDSNEDAALLTADSLTRLNRNSDFENLRKVWKGKETKQDRWLAVDADNLILNGQRQEAIKLLNSSSFEGKQDTGRLVRLAALTVETNPRAAWDYLTEASNKDPENPEIRSYRARLLEAVGKLSLALNEYLGAIELAPTNLFMRDQLAEFYRRNGQYEYAIRIWNEAIRLPSADIIWLKMWFWSHMYDPGTIKWEELKPPEGHLKPFLNYLYGLRDSQYWDDESFNRLSNPHNYLESQQSTFWLRLINAFQRKDENAAWELLQYNPFESSSWNRDLEVLLRQILTYRKLGTFSIDPTLPSAKEAKVDFKPVATEDPKKPVAQSKHTFFKAIEDLAYKKRAAGEKIPDDLHSLLMSDDAIATAFLAAGWLEVALDLVSSNVFPINFPDWVSYGFTQAIRHNRGNLAALEFATKQPTNPAMSMLIGELLIANGSPEAGMEQLSKLATADSEIGYRSAWLLSLVYIDRQKYDLAKETITAQPRLAKDVIGKETLARIALLQGQTDLADKLYSEIEAQSWEAKSYLARKAFSDKNYKRAQTLTEALLREFPASQLLRENLKRIIEEEGSTKK